MRPADIELLSAPRSPALRGDLALIALSSPDLARNSYASTLRRVGLDGGEQRWSQGEQDTSPAISPDGRWVAFLRSTGKSGIRAKPQVHVMPSTGGEALCLTELPLGADAPVWAGDSRRIAFTARIPEPGRYGTPLDGETEPPEAAEEAPRRITRFDYRLDNVGFLRDRPKRLFVMDAVSGWESGEPVRPEPLTDDAADVADPAWTPDGQRVLVVAPRDWDRTETLHRDIYAVPAAGGAPVLVVRTAGDAAKPVVDERGTVWFYSDEFSGFAAVARNNSLWSAPLPAGHEPVPARRVTEAESVDCDVAAGPAVPFGDEVLVAVRTRGSVHLVAVPRDAEDAPLDELPVLAGQQGAVRGFAADASTAIAVVSDAGTAGEVVLLDMVAGGAATTVLTDFAEPVRACGIRPLEELTATAPDGYPVHGWLVLPEGEGPHPVLLVIHGGPFAPYEWSLYDEAQVYVSAGYAVLLANPRGSAGYGEQHGRSIIGGLGTLDADDLLAFLDTALRRPDLDAERVGVMGGSYGGFMTGWLASHHGERFRAAWSERAVNAWDSFSGSSDIGWMFTDGYVGSDPEEQRRRSPLTYAGQIGIPFAVVHSEQDWRCPLEQAQRMFVALRQQGTPTEFLLFPGEGHELTRSGKPRHRKQRFDAVLDWWSRHLG